MVGWMHRLSNNSAGPLEKKEEEANSTDGYFANTESWTLKSCYYYYYFSIIPEYDKVIFEMVCVSIPEKLNYWLTKYISSSEYY